MKIPDLIEIGISWKRSLHPTAEQEAIADHRLEVCDTCEFKEFSTATMMYKCRACGCPLRAKVYSPKGPGACPQGKWSQ